MVTANQSKESIPNGEYIIRLLDDNANLPNQSTVVPLMAEFLEGDYDGRRLRINFVPAVARGSASARRLERVAKPGACFLAKVASRIDGAGRRRNIITRLFFLGVEPTSAIEIFGLN
ncbi:MAG: hypothetical protein ACLP9L_07730 [Thermoguttaceae bacterium]